MGKFINKSYSNAIDSLTSGTIQKLKQRIMYSITNLLFYVTGIILIKMPLR